MSLLRRHIFVCYMAKSAFWGFEAQLCLICRLCIAYRRHWCDVFRLWMLICKCLIFAYIRGTMWTRSRMRTTTISTQHLASTIFVICVCTFAQYSHILEFLQNSYFLIFYHQQNTGSWVMIQQNKQNGVNYIWSESSNRLAPVALWADHRVVTE